MIVKIQYIFVISDNFFQNLPCDKHNLDSFGQNDFKMASIVATSNLEKHFARPIILNEILQWMQYLKVKLPSQSTSLDYGKLINASSREKERITTGETKLGIKSYYYNLPNKR